MTEKARAIKAEFLSSPYSGYRHQRGLKEDEELTHVGPGTPCGEYLRRFWQPVAISSEVKDLSAAVRILGEDLVLFRVKTCCVGLLDRYCCHLGTSLASILKTTRVIHGGYPGC